MPHNQTNITVLKNEENEKLNLSEWSLKLHSPLFGWGASFS